jgi:hypothetical protein
MKPRGNSLEPGTPVIMQLRQVGGTTQFAGIVTWIVTWDDGRGNVSVKIPSWGGRIMRTKKDASGQLSTYG